MEGRGGVRGRGKEEEKGEVKRKSREMFTCCKICSSGYIRFVVMADNEGKQTIQ